MIDLMEISITGEPQGELFDESRLHNPTKRVQGDYIMQINEVIGTDIRDRKGVFNLIPDHSGVELKIEYEVIR